MGAKTQWHVEILATHKETRTISAASRNEAVERVCRERGVICVVGVRNGAGIESDAVVCAEELAE